MTDADAAAFLNVGMTTFQDLRYAPWMPKPIVLGPRLVRWSRSELEAAVAGMPRQLERSEPAQLARGRIEKLKGRTQ